VGDNIELNKELEKQYEATVAEKTEENITPKSGLERFILSYNNIMCTIATVFLAGFIVSVIVQVSSRTFLPKSPSWTEELARYFFIYMVAFGASVAVHTREFVGVDLLIVYFPAIVRKGIEIIIHIVLLCTCGYILKNSVLKFALIKYRMVSTALQINMKYVYFSMIILFSLLVFSYILEIIYIITVKKEAA